MSKAFRLTIEESLINEPGSGVTLEPITIGDSMSGPVGSSMDNPHEFSSTRAPVNQVGMAAGSQHPGFDSPPGMAINYFGFFGDQSTNGWNLERMPSGIPYFRSPSADEYMACPHTPAPVTSNNTYPRVDLPTRPLTPR